MSIILFACPFVLLIVSVYLCQSVVSPSVCSLSLSFHPSVSPQLVIYVSLSLCMSTGRCCVFVYWSVRLFVRLHSFVCSCHATDTLSLSLFTIALMLFCLLNLEQTDMRTAVAAIYLYVLSIPMVGMSLFHIAVFAASYGSYVWVYFAVAVSIRLSVASHLSVCTH